MKKIIDQYYFKEVEPEQLKHQLSKAVITRNDIRTMD
jgi:hypothetical protein